MRAGFITIGLLVVSCLTSCDKFPARAPAQDAAPAATNALPTALYTDSDDAAAIATAPTAVKRRGQVLTLFDGPTEIASFSNDPSYCDKSCSRWDFLKPLKLFDTQTGSLRTYYVVQEVSSEYHGGHLIDLMVPKGRAYEYHGEILVDLKGHAYDLDGSDSLASADGKWLAVGNTDVQSGHTFSIVSMATPQKMTITFAADCQPLEWKTPSQLDVVCTFPQQYLGSIRRLPTGKWQLTPVASPSDPDKVWDGKGNILRERFDQKAGTNNPLPALDAVAGEPMTVQDINLTFRGYTRLINDDGSPANPEVNLLAAYKDTVKREPGGLVIYGHGKPIGRFKDAEDIKYAFAGLIGQDAPMTQIYILADEINDDLIVDRDGWLFDVGPAPLMSWDRKYLASGFYGIFSAPGFFITDWETKARVVFDADCTPERWEDSTHLLALCDAVKPSADISHMRVRVTRTAKGDWTMTEIQALSQEDTVISKAVFTPIVRQAKPAGTLKPSTEWAYTRLAKP